MQMLQQLSIAGISLSYKLLVSATFSSLCLPFFPLSPRFFALSLSIVAAAELATEIVRK